MEFSKLNRLLGFLTMIAILGMFFLGTVPLIIGVPLALLILATSRTLIRKGKPKYAASLNLIFLSLGFTVIGIDLIVRIFAGGLLYYRPHEIYFISWPEYPLAFRYRPDVSVEMETYGDLAAISGNPEFRIYRDEVFLTDQFGFRNSPEIETDPYDLILLGDSLTAGSGTSQELIWPSLLDSQHGLHVYNMGIPGSPWNSYLNFALETDQIALEPGTVVLLVLFPGNDLDEPYGALPAPDEIQKNSFLGEWISRLETFQSRSIFRRLFQRVYQSVGAGPAVTSRKTDNQQWFLFFNNYIERSQRSVADIQNHPNFNALIDVLQKTQSLVTEQSAEFAVVIMPPKEKVYEWLLNEEKPEIKTLVEPNALTTALTDTFEALDIPYLDLTPALATIAIETYLKDEQMIFWPDDSHPNPLGHAILAELIFNFLTEDVINPASQP